MYIKREEAVVTLYDLINSSVLAEDICNDLTEIAGCIANEELGLDTWGADDEVTDLFVARREDLITEEWEDHLCNYI